MKAFSGTLVALEYSGGTADTRRKVKCPSCHASFNPGKVKRTWKFFSCPECGELLEYKTATFSYVLFFFCLYGVPALLYYVGYRSLSLIPISIAVATVIFFVGSAIYTHIFPPEAQQKLNYGDTGLHLTDTPKDREDRRPTDDESTPV